MPSLVKDLMTTQVVTVTPKTPFKKIVACLAEHRVTALPVVDDQGLVLGVVSEADLLKVFSRPDEDLRREILDQVLMGQFALDPSRFLITVHDGVVTLEGRVEQRSLLPWVLRAVHGVEGVVRVENRLTYDTDDLEVARSMTYLWAGGP